MGDLLWSLILAAVRLDPRILVRIAGAQSAPATRKGPVACLLVIRVVLWPSDPFLGSVLPLSCVVLTPGVASRIASRPRSAVGSLA